MNILVVNPPNKPFTNKSILAEPIDVLQVATIIRNEFNNVKVIDMDVNRMDNNINKYLTEDNIVVFVYDYQLPLHTSDTVNNMFEIIKNSNKKTKFIIIGKTSSYYYEKFLNNGFDVVINGIADNSIINTIDCIINQKDLSLIPNIIIKKNNEILITERTKIDNKFELLNYPDRSLVNLNEYMDTRTMITSRGCIGKCSFCTTPTFFGNWNGKNSKLVVDEIESKSKTKKTTKKPKEKIVDTDKYNQPKKSNTKEVLVDKYIYQLGKNKFRVRIKIGNKSNPNSIDFSKTINGTLAEARKIRDKKLAEYKLGVGGSPKSTIKFYDFAKIWYTEYCLKELSPSTWRTNELSLKNYVFPFIGNVPLNKIDALMIQKMINSLKEQKKTRPEKDGTYKTLSLTTVNGAYRLVRKILNKAVAWDYLDKNPVNKVKAPGDAKTEKESFNKKELLEVLELLNKEPAVRKAMFTICICTGIRRCELIGLHLDDIDFKKKTIKVCRSAVWNKLEQRVTEKETKTKGSVREIPIPDFCLKAIEEFLVHRDRQVKRFKKMYGKDFNVPNNIFLSVEGKIMNPSTATSLWNKFRKKYPHLKDVSLHGLRHSYCSMQMNENDKLSPSDVAKIMGHSQLTTTYRYTHSNEDKTDDAISIFYDEQKAPYRTFNFNQVLSVITGRKYASTNEINDLLDYVFPNSVDVPINERLSQVKEAILDDYPNLENISDDGLNVTNIWDWLEEKKNEYGDKFAISAEIVAIKNNTLEL